MGRFQHRARKILSLFPITYFGIFTFTVVGLILEHEPISLCDFMRITFIIPIIKIIPLHGITLVTLCFQLVHNTRKSIKRVIIIVKTVLGLELLAEREFLSLWLVIGGFKLFQFVERVVVGIFVVVIYY